MKLTQQVVERTYRKIFARQPRFELVRQAGDW